jgi:hypothetical protein
MKICSIERCGKKHKSKGFCNNHYIKWRYTNDEEYRQGRILKSAKRKAEWLKENPANRARHNATNLNSMKKRYDSNPDYKKNEQERTKNFRREKYSRDEKFRRKEKTAATMRKRHIKVATPKWANLDAIKNFYDETPEGFHVDHIIPLRGENVSGLHVEYNLQYLSAEENLIKGNKV